MRPHNRLAYKSKRRSNPRRGESKRGKPARVYFGGGVCPDGAGRAAARDRPGGIRGRRGIIGGYWGGYSLLSLSPTPRALPGKVENLTPPANGKNAPDGAPPAQPVPRWNVASRNRCAWISASASSGPAPEPGNRPPPPTTCTGMHPAQHHHANADQRPEQQRTPRRLPWPFSFAYLPALPPARPAGSAAARPDDHTARTMTTPAHRRRSRSHRPPPAPGRISTASAAPDDHARSRPPPTMTTHQQRQPCPTCTAPTACQPCQTSQRQRSRQRRHRGGRARQRRPPAAACIAAACRMIRPAAPRKTAILPRRRRGQILHLTG